MVQYRVVLAESVQEGTLESWPQGGLALKAEEKAGQQAAGLSFTVTNTGDKPVELRELSLGIPWEKEGELLGYSSSWGNEWLPFSHSLAEDAAFGVQAGRSSNGCMPWAGLRSQGECMALALGWSGNWQCRWEAAGRILWLGFCGFSTLLKPEESLASPWVYYGRDGDMEEACLRLRRFFRDHLSRIEEVFPKGLPVVWNSWWAYEDKEIGEDIMLANVQAGKALGVTHSLLDAGWFGREDQGEGWYEKRGDWYTVNQERFPSGLEALSQKIEASGVVPGIWCEIEALGKEAVLLRQRPELAARAEGQPAGYLCFGNPDTRQWAMEVMDWLIREKGYRWIKIDFNLDPPSCQETAHGHGAQDGLLAHYRGLYGFLEEVRRRYPSVVLENCSSGGLRLDIEMASQMHLCFLSDKDHTEFHLQVFWGALNWLHQSSCYHFTWSQVFGDHNLDVRDPMTEDTPDSAVDCMFRAAMMGVPGISLRLVQLSDRQRQRIREHLRLYHEISEDFVKNGDIRRLTGQPLENGQGERFPVFQLSAKSDRHVLFCFRLRGAPDSAAIKPRALDPGKVYQVRRQDLGVCETCTGAQLMETGWTLTGLPEFSSELVWITPEG